MTEGVVDRAGLIVLGRIGGPHGVKGWVRIQSFTDPRENILSYPRWFLGRGAQWAAYELSDGRMQGKSVVALLSGVESREAAESLKGREIAVPRDELPPLPEGEYYWADLIGLRVRTVDGVDLGVVDHLIQTGANDVLVVRGDRERLIPMVVGQYVKRVDLDAGRMDVDWDPEF
ncbi:MAG: ribosome maturation factor RimM [Ectothiorhodospiraceae bacterium]|nr:ribosome maturation factor RimM [Ectothiorhodospiraceae bacterium]